MNDNKCLVIRTKGLDTIEAVGLRAISGTIKKSDHTTIGHKRMNRIKGREENNGMHCEIDGTMIAL